MKLFISICLLTYLLIFGVADAQVIAGSTINNKAINFVKEILSEENDVEVYTTRAISNIKAPEGKVNLKISGDAHSAIGNHYTIPVKITINNQTFKTLYVNVKAKIYKNVVKTTSSIRKNSVISKEDICVERTDITKIRNKDSLFTEKENVTGMMATSYIPANKAITSKLIDLPNLVEKASTIKINASIGNIEASLYGIALQSGRKGDVITIMNPKTKKEFLARVIAPNLASVVF